MPVAIKNYVKSRIAALAETTDVHRTEDVCTIKN